MQVSADSAVRLGQSYARLAQAQGSPAAASQILAGTIGQAGAASEKALIGIETQAARVGASGTYFQQFGSAAASNLTSVVGPAALATASLTGLIAVGKSFADAFKFKTDLDQSTASIKVLLNGVRDSGEVFAGAARFAAQYKLTQQETTEAIQSSIPVIRNSKASIEEVMGVFARLKVLKPEKSFGDAARALGELQAGQIVSIVDQFNLSRSAANKMKDEIAGGADAVSVLSKYLTSAGVGMDALAVGTTGAAGKMRELAQAQEQLKLSQAAFAQGPGLVLLQGQIQATTGATRVLSGDFESARQSIAGAADAGSFGFKLFDSILAGSLSNIATYQNAADQSAAAARENAAATAEWDAAVVAASGVASASTDIEQQRANVLALAAAVTQQAQAASLGYATALEQAGVQARAAAQADQQKADADQLGSVAAQTHAVAQNALAQQAQIAAAALLGAGGAGASTAAVLAGSSSQVDVLTAAYYRLAAAQAAAGHAATLAKLQTQTARQLTGADSEVAGLRDSKHNQAVEDRNASTKAAREAADAERNYQQTLGNTAPALAHARDELAQLTKGSAAYINKQNEIAQLQQKADSIAKKGAKGAGSAKLSDQQKLQNSLLDSQEEYERKSEDAVTAHAVEVEKINRDAYTKMLAAQKDFDQAQLDDRAGFYAGQASIESAGVRQAASQAYEAASIEAGKIAAEKGADVGNKYMDAQEQIISDRAKRQDEIEKASNKKDKKTYDPDKAEYLKGVDALERKAEDARIARIKEGEGSIADEKQKKLDDAAAKEADALDKIGLAADRAAEKKITSSDRAGKKIDEEQLKVDGLTTSYDKLGAAGARAGITPAATPAAAAPTTSATDTTAAAPADSPLAVALQKFSEGQAAVVAAVKAAGDQVASAVRQSSSGKLAS